MKNKVYALRLKASMFRGYAKDLWIIATQQCLYALENRIHKRTESSVPAGFSWMYVGKNPQLNRKLGAAGWTEFLTRIYR